MRVISQKVLRDFWAVRPDSRDAVQEVWHKTALAADWKSLGDVRRIYRQADGVSTRDSGTLTVFNIRGNQYRLVARIRYEWRLINIRCVLTHAEYDKGAWKE